jgi:hypothetical protein
MAAKPHFFGIARGAADPPLWPAQNELGQLYMFM